MLALVDVDLVVSRSISQRIHDPELSSALRSQVGQAPRLVLLSPRKSHYCYCFERMEILQSRVAVIGVRFSWAACSIADPSQDRVHPASF
jgi:hypothetical protein